MLDKILSFIKKFNMIPPGSAVVCGLSGGADSVCLLTSLFMLREKLNINIEALHVNHCIRGEESDRDEQFCRDLCAKLDIPFTAFSCDVPSYASDNSLSIEEAARLIRYQAFERFSQGKLIATAHNANDNLETAILNLARGTGLKGLTGIPPIRGNIIRPLLVVTRNEIEEFLSENHYDFVTDSTNLDDDFTRNKIRHSVIPVLLEINPMAVNTSVNSFDTLRDENALIDCMVDNALKKCRRGNKLIEINSFEKTIRRRCIAALLSDNSLPYSYARLKECDDIAVHGGKINISGNFYFISDGHGAELVKILPKSDHEELSKELIIGENTIFNGITLVTELINSENFVKTKFVNTILAIYYLDYDKIIGKPILRNRRYGDKIQLCGRSFNSSVKKMINENVPPEERDSLHFISDDHGLIFAEKLGIAQRTAPDAQTKRYLKITVKKSTVKI